MDPSELLDQDKHAAGELANAAGQPIPANSGALPGQWWHSMPDGRLQCDLCPRACRLREGQRGFCFVRQALGGRIVLTSYGRNTGMAVDPIEKKPLYHFLPGSRVLSFGTAGCSLGCRFCQNWHISRTRQQSALSTRASPHQVAAAASHDGCRSVAFTYNEPSIFAEYAIDCARQAHRLGLRTVAVTSGYICADARADLYQHIDAANVDLKAFDDDFYRQLCGGSLVPVLDTLRWLKRETDVWMEITTLLIPHHNDSPEEIARLVGWVLNNLGPDVPLHFTAFHPDFRMRDVPPTPLATLQRARTQALAAGVHFVYTGNVLDDEGSSTTCRTCGTCLITRRGYQTTVTGLEQDGICTNCGTRLPGRFA